MRKEYKNNNNLNSEQELISSAKSGDINAFNKLISQYTQTILNFSFKICRNEERAKDVFQDTLINIYKSLKLFDGRSKFSTWIYKIVSNNCLMMARGNQTAKFISIDTDELKLPVKQKEIIDQSHTPAQKILNDELKSKLDDAIEKLPIKYRMVFLLRDIEELSIDETSKILNLSIPVIKSRLHRARIFLRNQLADYYEQKN